MSKIQCWCRANAMLVISLLAAVVTAFLVPPDRDYLGYYDLKTLACLFCVLAVVGALRDLHIFSALSQRMVHTFSTVRGVCTALVVITMFGSMLLTNDTALLTFLPLGWFVLSSTGQEKHTALLFILQNCAANLCGMITPFGNPQNLYLFSYYDLSTKTFFSAMLPPFILSTVLILLCCLAFPKDRLSVPEAQAAVDSRRAVIYGGLFCLAVAMVLRLVPYVLGLTVIVLALWFLDRHALKTVDCWPPSPRSSPFPAILPGWNLSGYCSPAFCPMGPCWSPRLPARSSAMFPLPFCSAASRRMPAGF